LFLKHRLAKIRADSWLVSSEVFNRRAKIGGRRVQNSGGLKFLTAPAMRDGILNVRIRYEFQNATDEFDRYPIRFTPVGNGCFLF
jgi:hypothetical protein